MSGPPDRDAPASGAATGGREIYLEFIPLGNSVKVVAVDAATGTEVSIVGPVSAARGVLERNAVRKLQYVMEKNRTD